MSGVGVGGSSDPGEREGERVLPEQTFQRVQNGGQKFEVVWKEVVKR